VSNRIILLENMDSREALCLIKTLSTQTAENDRYRFVFTHDKKMIVAKTDEDNPTHEELSESGIDKVMGYVSFVFSGEGAVIHAYLNNEYDGNIYSKFEDLKEPQILIAKIFGPISIDMEDIPRYRNRVIDLSIQAVHEFH